MPSDRLSLVEKDNNRLPITTQCALLQLNRSTVYYEKKPQFGPEDKILMDEIDRIYTKRPFFGAPRITDRLHKTGFPDNHKRVARLMRLMGLQALRPKKRLSIPDKSHDVYPYLLENVTVGYPNHVWSVDITYVKLRHEFMYLFAVLDWYSRYVLSWELSDTMTSDFCCDALKRALTINIPGIHNADQGSQTSGADYVGILKKYPSIKISMDHKGRCFDNIFVERLWRSVKYEEVYLKDYQTPKEARQSLNDYFHFYNTERPHRSLKMKTPAEIYFDKSLQIQKKEVQTF